MSEAKESLFTVLPVTPSAYSNLVLENGVNLETLAFTGLTFVSASIASTILLTESAVTVAFTE